VNGIDGVMSSAIGAALTGKNSVCLIGDLAFLHDLSALVEGLGPVPGSLTVVVVNNGGGGIFSFLPQATSVEPSIFDALFHTARPVNHQLLVSGLGHHVEVVATRDGFNEALRGRAGQSGLSVIVVEVGTPATNVALHDELNQAISLALVGLND
jgi:2-succinyl-5-enolpyruvyl-6-hydroxy-3-cyclohexene-1-carboxylate synthase